MKTRRFRLRLPPSLRLDPLVHFRRVSEACYGHYRQSGRPHPCSCDLYAFDCAVGHSHFDEAVVGRESCRLEVQPRWRSHRSHRARQYDPVAPFQVPSLVCSVRATQALVQRVLGCCPQHRVEVTFPFDSVGIETVAYRNMLPGNRFVAAIPSVVRCSAQPLSWSIPFACCHLLRRAPLYLGTVSPVSARCGPESLPMTHEPERGVVSNDT